jgi:hypothetical protein
VLSVEIMIPLRSLPPGLRTIARAEDSREENAINAL